MKKTSNPFDSLSDEISSIKKEIQLLEKRKSETSTQSKLETLLTCEEVLKIFHISRPTLRRWEVDQKITPIRVGRRLLFKESAVLNLTSGQKEKGESQ